MCPIWGSDSVTSWIMASIEPRTGKTASTWRVRWTHARQRESLTFDTDRDARRCASLVEGLRHDISAEDAWRQLNGITEQVRVDGFTLDVWARRWASAKTGITDATRDGYLSHWSRLSAAIIDGRRLGGTPLAEVTAETVGLIVRHLQDADMAAATVHRYHATLHQILAAAVTSRHITYNPAAGTRLPKIDKGQLDEGRVYLTHEQAQALVSGFAPGMPTDLVVTLLATGLRWGEVTALRVIDVSPDVVQVRRAWKRSAQHGWHVGAPKSHRSRRTVSLPPRMAAVVQRLTDGRSSDDLVFSHDGLSRLTRDHWIDQHWAPAVRRAQSVGLTVSPLPHDLRHTHASWLIADRVPLPAIQRRLGHESITTTIDTYGHLLPELDTELLAGLDRVLPDGHA